MLIDFIKAFALGICASAPIGPVLIWVMRKSLSNGWFPAFIAALGAAFVDTLYAVVALSALSLISDFISQNERIIYLVGGIVIAIVGAGMALRKPEDLIDSSAELRRDRPRLKDFFTTLGMALANPGALALMIALVAVFNIHIGPGAAPAGPVFFVVACGAVAFWLFFCLLVGLFRRAIKAKQMKWVNRVAGVVIVIFGLYLTLNGINMIV